MAISSYSQYLAALPVGQRLFVSKSSTGGASGTQLPWVSMWKSSGTPGAGSNPATSPEICTKATTGSIQFNNASGANKLYLAQAHLSIALTGSSSFALMDRLSQISGLSSNSTSVQTVNVDASDSSLTSRIGTSDYSQVQFWLEFYANTGVSASPTITVNYTNTSNVSQTTVVPAIGTSIQANRIILITPTNGDIIKSIQSVQLSAGTGSVGNFGVTAVRVIAPILLPDFLQTNSNDWTTFGLPSIENDACLFFSCGVNTYSGSASGALSGFLILVEG